MKILTQAKATLSRLSAAQPRAWRTSTTTRSCIPWPSGSTGRRRRKAPTDFATLTQISRCYGKLNQEKSSIEYLTRILKQYPDSSDTVDDLGWMYFKTHQLEKGEQVLLKGIARLGMQRGMAMTLGTVYSGLNKYDKSREYYLKSVDEALRVGDRDFAAIAYYNLSLLEHNFFHYNSALRYTDESIAMEDRPSGHLARGELFQARMDFASAEQEYQAAYAKDTTPLSKVNLAILFQKFGRLDLARRYAEEVLGLQGPRVAGVLRHRHHAAFQGHARAAGRSSTAALRGARRPGRPTGVIDRAARSSPRRGTWCSPGTTRSASTCTPCRWAGSTWTRGPTRTPGGSSTRETKRTPRWRSSTCRWRGSWRPRAPRTPPSSTSWRRARSGGPPRSWQPRSRASIRSGRRSPRRRRSRRSSRCCSGESNAGQRRDAIARLYAINPGALPQAGIGLPLAVDFRGDGWSRREKGPRCPILEEGGIRMRAKGRGRAAAIPCASRGSATAVGSLDGDGFHHGNRCPGGQPPSSRAGETALRAARAVYP